jgi:hypothetical protein
MTADARSCPTWWCPSDGLPDTDTVFLLAQDSIRALDVYRAAEGVSTAALTEAIRSRCNYLVSLGEE